MSYLLWVNGNSFICRNLSVDLHFNLMWHISEKGWHVLIASHPGLHKTLCAIVCHTCTPSPLCGWNNWQNILGGSLTLFQQQLVCSQGGPAGCSCMLCSTQMLSNTDFMANVTVWFCDFFFFLTIAGKKFPEENKFQKEDSKAQLHFQSMQRFGNPVYRYSIEYSTKKRYLYFKWIKLVDLFLKLFTWCLQHIHKNLVLTVLHHLFF